MNPSIRRAFPVTAVLGLLYLVSCQTPDCEDTFMQAGDEVRVTVLGPKEPGSASCGILPLAADTTFVRMVVGEVAGDANYACTGAKGEPEPPDVFAPIVSECQQSSGLGVLCQQAELQDGCIGRMGMQLAIGSLSKGNPLTDDGLMNVNWAGDDCYAIGCQDQYAVRLEWIPKPKE